MLFITHACVYAKLLQLCPILCDPMDGIPPGFSVHGILQQRILEWVAMPSSRDLTNPGIKLVSPAAPAMQVVSLPLEPPGKPPIIGKAN